MMGRCERTVASAPLLAGPVRGTRRLESDRQRVGLLNNRRTRLCPFDKTPTRTPEGRHEEVPLRAVSGPGRPHPRPDRPNPHRPGPPPSPGSLFCSGGQGLTPGPARVFTVTPCPMEPPAQRTPRPVFGNAIGGPASVAELPETGNTLGGGGGGLWMGFGGGGGRCTHRQNPQNR